jgi:putative transposase
MISFIDEHRGVFGVEPICRVLPIAPSTYYENVAKRLDVDRLSIRARSDISLKIEIRRVFNENFRGLWRSQGLAAVAAGRLRCRPLHGRRLMRVMGLQGIIRGKADPNDDLGQGRSEPARPGEPPVQSAAPNRLWVSDFTYVATWQGFVYVAFRHRRLCSSHRRLAGEPDGTCGLRPRCPGAGAS